MSLTQSQADAIRYLLGLPIAMPARRTMESLYRADIVVGPEWQLRVAPDHRARLCSVGGLTDAQAATVAATLARWRRWDLEAAAAEQETSQANQLIQGLPGHLRQWLRASHADALTSLAADATVIADKAAAAAGDFRRRAAEAIRAAEIQEADAAALRDLVEAAKATPRPVVAS